MGTGLGVDLGVRIKWSETGGVRIEWLELEIGIVMSVGFPILPTGKTVLSVEILKNDLK